MKTCKNHRKERFEEEHNNHNKPTVQSRKMRQLTSLAQRQHKQVVCVFMYHSKIYISANSETDSIFIFYD